MNRNVQIWKVSLLLLVGMLAFVYVVIGTVADVYYLVTDPVGGIMYRFDSKTGEVIVEEAVRGGPAEQAGVQAGDVILSVNDQPLREKGDLPAAMNRVKVGDTVSLTLRRGDTTHQVSFRTDRRVAVYSRAIFLALLPGVLFCYTLCLIGTFVLLKRLHDPSAHMFFLMVVCWALAMWHEFPHSYHALEELLPEWYTWLRLPLWPLAVGLLAHFSLKFPVEKTILRRHPRLILGVIYLPLFLVVPVVYAGIQGMNWGETLLDYGWGILFTLDFAIALHMLSHSRRNTADPHVAKQAQIMFWGTFFTLVLPTGLYYLPRIFLKQALPYSDHLLLLLVFWPMTLAYVIVKHRFMDIDVIVKRGVAYALMSGFVIGAYFLFVVGVGQLVLLLTGSRSQIVTIVATLLIAALFNPVKNRVQRFVDRRFYPSRFVFREAVQAFTHGLVNVVDLRKLFDLLKAFFTDTMRISTLVFYWRTPDDAQFHVRDTGGGSGGNLPVFDVNDRVIKRLGERIQLQDLSELEEEPSGVSEDEMKRWKAFGAELVLPLFSQGTLRGFIVLGSKQDRDPYFREDLELLNTLGDHINISLENALLTEELREQERLKKELEVARRIQLGSLPQVDPTVPGLDISGISIPAMEVGGDYYDYLHLNDGALGVVVGDVSGKGTSAALYMSQLKGILQTAAKYHASPRDLVCEVNALTYGNIEVQSYITLTVAKFDPGRRKLHLVRAGHLPIMHYCAERNRCEHVQPRGIGIGLEQGRIFNREIEEVELDIHPGDVFLFYTDGIVEVRNARGDEFDARSLAEVLEHNGWCSAVALRKKIVAHVQRFATESYQKDDMTLVVVKVVSS